MLIGVRLWLNLLLPNKTKPMKKLRAFVSLLLLAALFAANVPRAAACGPSFDEPVFAFDSRAESFERFARGDFGVVKNRYNPIFLTAAYRYFNNRPFTAAEQRDLIAVWRANYNREDSNESNTDAAVKQWLTAREKVLPDASDAKIYTDRANSDGQGYYGFFPNCTKNAFETAARTLENRQREHAPESDNLKDWTRAQDAVFTNCDGGDNKKLPVEIAANAPAWLKNDREYQTAAAQFYAMNFEDAKTRFQKIAADQDSAWRATADYLVARTLIRQASLDTPEFYQSDEAKQAQIKQRNHQFYVDAEQHLQQFLNNPANARLRDDAAKLLNLVAYRLHPAERLAALSQKLAQAGENPNLRQDLIDFHWLLDRNPSKDSSADVNDLTDWIVTFRGDDKAAAFKHAVDKFRQTNSPAWLTAAISQAAPNQPETAELLRAADKLNRPEAAFLTVAYHQNRLLLASNQTDAARTKLDAILADKNLSASARNRFAAQKMMTARSLDEFLQFAPRRAEVFAADGNPYLVEDFAVPTSGEDYLKNERLWLNRQMFDTDAARIFNEAMPLRVLQQAATNPTLPDYLKRQILIAAWTKAVLLEDDRAAQDLSKQFAAIAPEFNQIFAQYIAAQTAAERRNAATYILLKFPGLTDEVPTGYGRRTVVGEIDGYRDNWFCAPTGTIFDDEGKQIARENFVVPPFLTADVAVVEREREQLKKVGGAATYLATRAVAFAQFAPNDTRVAESLHLAVRATRYGCTDCATGKASKQAHDLLKKNFPTSEWTKKTPYWFKDESCPKQQ